MDVFAIVLDGPKITGDVRLAIAAECRTFREGGGGGGTDKYSKSPLERKLKWLQSIFDPQMRRMCSGGGAPCTHQLTNPEL